MSDEPLEINAENSHYVQSFRELYVYKEARELARDIYYTTTSFPKEETYSLTDQIRRCSRSIGANIAEAWAKREYPAHFISKLSDSLAENFETQSWLDHALDCNYITPQQYQELDSKAQRLGAIIRKTSAKAHAFSGKLDRPN